MTIRWSGNGPLDGVESSEHDAMLAGAGEEDEFITCYDDITVKELPKETREKELKYMRELGVYEKVDERATMTKCSRHKVG